MEGGLSLAWLQRAWDLSLWSLSDLLPGDRRAGAPWFSFWGSLGRGLCAAPGSLTAAPACSYSLSCELEPPSESASNTLKTKKSTAIVKRWSE